MKKKVIVSYKDGGKLTYRGYADRDDTYFIALHRFSLGITKITRQYYPLKDNKAQVIFDSENNIDADIKEIRKAIEGITLEIKEKIGCTKQ